MFEIRTYNSKWISIFTHSIVSLGMLTVLVAKVKMLKFSIFEITLLK